MADNYEMHNTEVDATLTAIGAKIRPALPEGWGFMLMLFEYKVDGAMFYASSGERGDVTDMVEEWVRKQRGEVNPDHPTTRKLHEQWHKITAVLLHKFALGEVLVTGEDLRALGALQGAVVADNQGDGLHVKFVDAAEAERLSREQERRRVLVADDGRRLDFAPGEGAYQGRLVNSVNDKGEVLP